MTSALKKTKEIINNPPPDMVDAADVNFFLTPDLKHITNGVFLVMGKVNEDRIPYSVSMHPYPAGQWPRVVRFRKSWDGKKAYVHKPRSSRSVQFLINEMGPTRMEPNGGLLPIGISIPTSGMMRGERNFHGIPIGSLIRVRGFGNSIFEEWIVISKDDLNESLTCVQYSIDGLPVLRPPVLWNVRSSLGYGRKSKKFDNLTAIAVGESALDVSIKFPTMKGVAIALNMHDNLMAGGQAQLNEYLKILHAGKDIPNSEAVDEWDYFEEICGLTEGERA